MMARVFVSAADWYWEDRVIPPSMTVIETEPAPRFSGLLDARGNRLFVIETREPAGFVKFQTR